MPASRKRSAKADRAGAGADTSALASLGLRIGEAVRFRRPDRGRWQPGRVSRIERDGSIGITDTDGSARAVPVALVEVHAPRRAGTRSVRWEPLADRAGRAEQLTLL